MNVPEALCRPDPLIDGLGRAARRVETPFGAGRIVWRVWGQGPPVVMLHGGSGSWMHWIHQIAAFRDEYTVIAPDLPGFGDSDEPPVPVDFLQMGRALQDGLDAIIGAGAEYSIAAFSYGGSITAQLVQVAGDRIKAILLAAPAGIAKPTAPPMQKVKDKLGDELVAAHRFNLGSIMVADPARIDDRAMRIQHENSTRSRLRARGMDRGRMLQDVLPGIAAPVVVVWGDSDGFVIGGGTLDDRVAMLTRDRADIEVHILPGVGHWVPYEAPEAVTTLLRDLLARRA